MQTDAQRHGKLGVRSSSILLLTALIWGMAFVAQRVGMDFIGPFLFMGIRMVLGAATLLLVLLFQGIFGRGRASTAPSPDGLVREMGNKRLVKAGIICGFVLFFGGALQQVGLVYTTASKAGFLTALYIVLVPIFGIVLKHKTHWNTWISVVIAVVGLYFLCITGSFSIAVGDLFMLMGAFFWAAHILVIDHFVVGLTQRDVMRLCIGQFAVAAALGLGFSLIFDTHFVNGVFNASEFIAALPSLLYVGILSTGIAFTLQAVGQQGVSPSAASIIMSMEAVFSVLGGMLILHEVLTSQELLGCILMFAAVILSQLPIGSAKQVT